MKNIKLLLLVGLLTIPFSIVSFAVTNTDVIPQLLINDKKENITSDKQPVIEQMNNCISCDKENNNIQRETLGPESKSASNNKVRMESPKQSLGASLPRYATISVDTKLRLREHADTNSTTLTFLANGTSYEILQQEGNFYKIEVDEDLIGYVSKDYVETGDELKEILVVKDNKNLFNNNINISSLKNMDVSKRQALVDYAKKFIGGPYLFGGTDLQTGVDCSGFTMRIYEHFGYNIGRSSRDQANMNIGKTIDIKDVKIGDLLFYASGFNINHVAIYIGDNKVVHASGKKRGIKIARADYRMPIKAISILD